MIAVHRDDQYTEIREDPGSGLNWSHEALQDALFYRPLRDGLLEAGPTRDDLVRYLAAAEGAERSRKRGNQLTADRLSERAERVGRRLDDQTRPAWIVIPERSGSYARLPPLTLPVIAAWLYATPAALDLSRLEQLLRPAALTRCHEIWNRVVELDHATPADNGEPSDAILADALEDGLTRFEGRHLLGGQATLYLQLVCRGYRGTRLRVCERCQLVHRAARARTCRRCRRSPLRLQPKPWHLAVAVATPGSATESVVIGRDNILTVTANRDRRPAKTTYIGVCVCGTPFRSTRAQTRYCALCGSPRARTARSRQRTTDLSDQNQPRTAATPILTVAA